MTREEAKRRAELYSALAEGKIIQFKQENGEWTDLKTDLMCGIAGSFRYRIKPELKYRPFKTKEECWNEMMKHHPFGSLKSKDNEYFCIIGSVNKDNTITLAIEPNTDYSCTYIFEHYIFSDGTPFGIMEE